MKKLFKKIFYSPLASGISIWITIFTAILLIFKFGYSLMINYPIWFLIFFIIGFFVMPTVYSIHTYYFQKKEIEALKTDTFNCLLYVLTKLGDKAAHIYHNLADINNEPYQSLGYILMSLEEYITIKDNKMIGQTLIDIIRIIKNINFDLLPIENIAYLNEIISNVNQKEFNTQVQQINEIIKKST